MATIDDARYSTQYTGLISTAGLALGVMSIMTVAFETFPRLPRRLARKKRPGADNEAPSVEDNVLTYLYRPRVYLGKHRGPRPPKWPLAWTWQVLKLPQEYYLRNAGLDSAVYVRWITACWFFMLSQLLTTVVILLPLHIHYAPDEVLPSSIAQASVSSLINSTSGGRNYLWVRTVLLWYQSISWMCVVVYVGWGNIRMRREQILDPLHDAKDEDADEENQGNMQKEGIPPGVNPKGWRFRTIRVSNVPSHMRSEQALRSYFDSCLSYIKKNPSAKFYESVRSSEDKTNSAARSDGVNNNTRNDTPETGEPLSATPTATSTPPSSAPSAIDHVVIVRKVTEIHELMAKRRAVLHELESAHVLLARAVMDAVAARVRYNCGALTLKERFSRHKNQVKNGEKLDALVKALGSYLPCDSKELKLWQFLNPDKQNLLPTKTLWEAIAELPKDLLDSYQPVIKLKVFRGQVAPSIDYYLTKLNLLTSLIDDLRARPDSYPACDSAFVTFTYARDARMIRKELSWIRARDLTCRVREAPDTRDLDWTKLIESSFKGDVLKSFIVNALVWAATILWILPISALIGLVSLDNLSTRIQALARWLSDNPKAKSLASSFIPTLIVTIINMLLPTIIIQVSGRGQTFVTLSSLHKITWARYWKWAIINVVIAFCAGTALFTSLLGIFTGSSFSETANNPLNVIASSFSNGAVFFVGYSILIIGTQIFFELAQFMIPWFLYLGVRKATTPRQRFVKSEPRRFFHYTVGPNQTLVIAIILTFSLLNPLPICFIFIYFTFAMLVFKDHFARLYWRVYYELNGRLFFTRLMRYSLDALVLGQVVNMALFFVLKQGKNGGACAALIPITVFFKLALTRFYDYHMDAADAAIADSICGQGIYTPPDKREEVLQPSKPDNHAMRKERRHAVNKHLEQLHLPELSFAATLRMPKVIKHNTRGPQAVITRLAKHLQHNEAYSEIKDSSKAREEANLDAARSDAAPSAEKTLGALELNGTTSNEKGHTSPKEVAPLIIDKATELIVPHPRLQRDDRPCFSEGYYDPHLVEPLQKHLWLPRNPLYPIDLDDTIDWYGPALVSSEGGDGEIGGWKHDEEEEEEVEEREEGQKEILREAAKVEAKTDETPLSERDATRNTAVGSVSSRQQGLGASIPAGSPLSIRSRSKGYSKILDGTETIKVASDIAEKQQQQNPATPEKTGFLFARRPSDTGSITSNASPRPHSLVSSPSGLLTPSAAVTASPLEDVFLRRTASATVLEATQPSSPETSTLRPPIAAEPSRRVHSEIVVPQEKEQARRPSIMQAMSPSPSRRNRSSTSASNVSKKTTQITQSRALRHEVMEEERAAAVERRQQEEERAAIKASNAKKTWRNLFMKPKENDEEE